MNLWQLFLEGGFIMWPLLICSLVSWSVAFEKFWFLSEFRKQFDSVKSKATQLIGEKKFHEARGLCHNVHPFIGTPLLAVLEGDRAKDKEMWEERIERRLREGQSGLRRYLWIIGTIGSLAPFIGLYGTVVGIIKSFDSIAVSGKSGFSVVASGLSEALVATAAGILVAVMSVMLYNYFQTRLSRVDLSFRNDLADMMDLVIVEGKDGA